MLLKDIVGRKIKDILVSRKPQVHGLDEADGFIVLEDGLVIGFPFYADNEETVWIREPKSNAETIFWRNNRLFFWQKQDPKLDGIKGCKITGFLGYEDDSFYKAYIELSSGKLLTEVVMAPHGTGHAGIWIIDSIQQLEESRGKDYKRLQL